jgi:cell division cycle protein 37
VEKHQKKIEDLQKELIQKLTELEAEERRKITSDSIHTGFSKTVIPKDEPKPKSKPAAKSAPEKTVEVLNPGALKKDFSRHDGVQSPGADADVDEPLKATQDADEDEPAELTDLSREFAKIKAGDYNASRRFIAENRDIVAERETDALLVEAFNALMDGKQEYGKQCIHQGLLLQYCRSLGRDGVDIFFRRINTPGHQAQKLFLDDVNSTYERIRKRTAELAKSSKTQDAAPVEQIQLHAVDPSTTIHINIPQPGSTDPVEQKAREMFERFPPGLQRALESGSLDRVNEVLGKMSVSEAEEVVEQLGEGGMLSLEEGVIDGTTEEGREKLERLEREAKEAKTGEEGDDPEGDEMDEGTMESNEPVISVEDPD